MNADVLELQVLSYAGGEAGPGLSVLLGYTPVSVGRSPACHLSLEDPERLISRSHLSAWIDAQGTPWLRNASSSTPVFIDGIELPPAGQTRLRVGQTIVLGRYLLSLLSRARAASPERGASAIPAVPGVSREEGTSVTIPEEFDVFALPPAPSTASGGTASVCELADFSGEPGAIAEVFAELEAFDARGPRPADGWTGLVGGHSRPEANSADDPLQRLLGGADALLQAPQTTSLAGAAALDQGSEMDGLFRLPSALSVPKDASGIPPVGSAPPSGASSLAGNILDPLELEFGSAAPGSADSGLMDLIGGAGGATGVQRAQTAGGSSVTLAGPTGADRSAIGAPGSAAEAAGSRQPDVIAVTAPEAPAPRQAFAIAQPASVPYGPSASTRGTAPKSSSAALGGVSSDPDVLAEAFARGCGLSPAQFGAWDEAAAENLGRLFHGLVAGALQLIHARSSTKHELRAQMTIIATSGNNPLKFAPDAHAAMLQLVGRGLPGFMPPVEAVRDAFNDLSAHQVGLLAASRSAMYAMAGRLSPEHIQQRVGGPRGFSGLLPSAHKAQLWDAFVAEHAKLLGEAREEFDAAFQGAFVDAYEGEVRRMQAVGSP